MSAAGSPDNTGERIRDKIAASKQKGLWMGGVLPLGYRVESRKLVIDLNEADIVRSMFKQYLQLGSLSALQQGLRDQGVRTRIRTLSNGKRVGGVPLNKGALSLILRNRTYLGDINHRGRSYPGEHEPIIAPDVFEAVQALIARNLVEKGAQRRRSQALLMARLRDDRGHAMSPSYAVKNGARYRYYVSQALVQGRKAEAGSLPRVAADAIEREVVKQIRNLDTVTGTGTEPSAADLEPVHHDDHRIDAALIQRLVDHVVVGKAEITIHLNTDGLAADQLPSMTFVWTPPSPTRQRQIIPAADAGDRLAKTPMTAQTRSKLVRSIAQARLWLDQLTRDHTATTEAIAKREGFSERAVRMKLSLAFLAPDIVEAAIAGCLPQSFGVTRLTDLPMDWTAQRRALGIAQPAP